MSGLLELKKQMEIDFLKSKSYEEINDMFNELNEKLNVAQNQVKNNDCIADVSLLSLHGDNKSWDDVISGYILEQNLNDAQEYILNDLIKYLDEEYNSVFNER